MFRSKLLWIVPAAVILCLMTCSPKKNTFKDSRNGKIYKTVIIGHQTWMAENLNFKTSNSWCYADSQINCEKYGRLYTMEAAKTACPPGWHLPSEEEWQVLERFLGMTEEQIDIFLMRGEGMGTKLKNIRAWESNIKNESDYDTYGFNALPGGYRYFLDGSFVDKGNRGSWWSSTPEDDKYAWRRALFLNQTGIDRDVATNTNAFCVRCIKDEIRK